METILGKTTKDWIEVYKKYYTRHGQYPKNIFEALRWANDQEVKSANLDTATADAAEMCFTHIEALLKTRE